MGVPRLAYEFGRVIPAILLATVLAGSVISVVAGTATVVAAAELPPVANRPIDFARDIKPLLAKHCLSCHGAEARESGLRLDSASGLLAGGDTGKAIVPGKSADSRLIHYIAGLDPKKRMPPDGEALSAESVGLFRAWIDQGASWPESENPTTAKNSHWAYQPLRVVSPPDVKLADWPVNPVDRFVLAELEKRGLRPSPEADRTTLIRRLSLDLLGLLPSVAEVDAFVNDRRENAYEQLVDRLLESPHFGERWGRHWLDMARYADSDGYEKDNPRPDAYRWRDWVIDAINSDLPFDQFTIEQLAGDLLPNANPMQRLATAFHRQTLTNTEGGTDQEQWRVEACFDRTETTGAVWLGLTVGCARCHTHKYDAISQREYYQLFAVFNNGDEQTAVVPKSEPEVAAYTRAKTEHDAAVAALTARIREAQIPQAASYAEWETKAQTALAEQRANPLVLHTLENAAVASDTELSFKRLDDASWLVSGPNPEKAVYTVQGTIQRAGINAIRFDAMADDSLPAKGPGRVAHGNFVLTELAVEVARQADFSDARKLALRDARADIEQEPKSAKPWLAQHAIDGNEETGWAISPQFGKSHWWIASLSEPLDATGTLHVRVRISQQHGKQHTIGRFKVTLQTGVVPNETYPEAIVKALAIPAEKRTAEQRQQLLDHFSRSTAPTQMLFTELDELRKKEPAKAELSVRVIAQRLQNPRKTFVFRRGEFLHPVMELETAPGGLATLPPLKARAGNAMADRLDLARWLVSPENPLTPRVTANHIWRQLFGVGLVRTPGDFGVRGERPSHPELLDWLAADLIAGAGNAGVTAAGGTAAGVGPTPVARPWSRKALIKRIVLSATYRQSSRNRRELHEIDPQNRLLARQNRLRVEGEIVRDISLDAAGLLARKVGGPSVYPPLPAGIAELSYAGNFKWNVSTGEDRYRRGMYTFFKRTSPHPNLTTFDCPDANLACLERRASNTPLQALTTLNNESFAEAARALALRVLATAATASDSERLAQAFRICVARAPQPEEMRQLEELLAASTKWYADRADQARELTDKATVAGVPPEHHAAWVATARVLLNLDEFVTRE
jgi:mono/diheme cytochrome c family protein